MAKNFFRQGDDKPRTSASDPPIDAYTRTEDAAAPEVIDDPGYLAAIDREAGARVVGMDGKPRQPTDAPPPLWSAEGGWIESDIPRRPWIVAPYIMRGSVTVLAGPGSAGKSSIVKAWLLASAFGLPFSKFLPAGPQRVISYNTEDDLNEERRRMSATLRQFGRYPEEVPDTLRIIGPEDIGTLIVRDPVSGLCVSTAAMTQLEAMIEEFQPDYVVLDPLVELHTSEENDNTALRAVVAHFRGLAQRHRIAVVLLHHTRKGSTQPGDPDAVRGAGAIIGAARVVLTCVPMSEDEASKLGIPSNRKRSYFRLDPAKSNYAPIEEAEWFQRVAYVLDNGEEVAAAEPWQIPSPWDGITWTMIGQMMEIIETGPSDGELFTISRRGGGDRWVGNVITQVTGKSDAMASMLVKAWTENGVLEAGEYRSPATRKMTPCVRVNHDKLSEMRRDNDTYAA